MEWYKLTALLALAICIIGLLVHLFKLVRLGYPKDYAQKAGEPKDGIKYSMSGAMSPKNSTKKREYYIVVDVETSGPNPSRYALLSIGACSVDDPKRTFYAELQPDRHAFTPDAMAVNGLSLEMLTTDGLPPVEALQRFADWVDQVVPKRRPEG